MTVSSTTTKMSYTGNGSTSVFAYTFKIFANTEIKVWVNGVLQTLTTHYTVSGAGSASGGNVTFETASIPASTHSIVFGRNIARTQVTDYVENDTFPAETHEAALDKLTLIAQEIDNKLSADIFKFAETVTDAGTVEITLDSATRSSKILSFDSTGGLVATQEIGVYTGNWAASTAYVVRDLIKDTSNNNIYICLTAHSSSGAQPISSNADVAKWALIVDAASASTSATAAATSATAAATSATAAATSATASATSSTSSSTSATASASSATGAASSASAASTSAAAAATSYDNFDDRFLGSASSDPTVDNDGDALITGALYFNSSNNVMMVYTGSAWVRTTPTSSDQTNINTLSASAVIADMALLATTDCIADMAILGTSDVVADLNTLATADVVADMNTLGTADVVADMNTLGTSDVVADLNTLGTADVVTDMNTLATSANVTAMGVLGTSANVTAMSTCSGSIANVNTTATNIANVNLVGSNITTVNTFSERYRVASSEPSSDLNQGDLYFNTATNEMSSYGTSWQPVAISAANQANINICAGDIVFTEDLGSITEAVTTSTGSDISTVADSITEINRLGTTAAVADLAILGTADVVSDLNTLGTADVVSDLNTLATGANVTAMNTLGTSANVTAMSNVSGSIASVNTVSASIADVNRYANEYTIASTAPAGPSAGDLWMDTTANVLKYYTGSAFSGIISGLTDIVADASPQLGGALDCQNNNVSNCGTIDGTNLQMDFGSIV